MPKDGIRPRVGEREILRKSGTSIPIWTMFWVSFYNATELVQEDMIVSSDAIKMRFLGEDEVSKTLVDLIGYHSENMVHVLKPGTMKNYHTTEKYLKRFLKSKLKREDIYLKQLNFRFILDLEHFLRRCTDKNKQLCLSNNGVMKHLERFKKKEDQRAAEKKDKNRDHIEISKQPQISPKINCAWILIRFYSVWIWGSPKKKG